MKSKERRELESVVQWYVNFTGLYNHFGGEGLIKQNCQTPTCKVSRSGIGLRIKICQKCTGDDDAAYPGTILVQCTASIHLKTKTKQTKTSKQ